MIEEKPTILLQRIFEIRRAKKISLQELATVLKVKTQEAASRIENGQIPLRGECIPAIAKLLKVEIWELFQDYGTSGDEPLNEEARSIVGLWRKLRQEDKNTIFNLMLSLSKTNHTKEDVSKKGVGKKAA